MGIISVSVSSKYAYANLSAFGENHIAVMSANISSAIRRRFLLVNCLHSQSNALAVNLLLCKAVVISSTLCINFACINCISKVRCLVKQVVLENFQIASSSTTSVAIIVNKKYDAENIVSVFTFVHPIANSVRHRCIAVKC